MKNILDVISLITSLTQLAARAMASSAELSALIVKARTEGRDISDAEMDAHRQKAVDALAKLNG